ncbi:hypothetical protein A4X03_0g9799, partial [Tilletia caries]
MQSGSEEPIFDLATVNLADLDVYVRKEEERARTEQDTKLAALQAKLDHLLAASAARPLESHALPSRSSIPPPSSSKSRSKTKRAGDRSSFRTEIAGVANAAKPSACARCGGRARHDVAHCDKTHFAKPSCSAYET